MDKEISMTTITDGFEPHTTTEPLRVYKWLAETMIYKHRGSKDITRIKYHEKYDGYKHAIDDMRQELLTLEADTKAPVSIEIYEILNFMKSKTEGK